MCNAGTPFTAIGVAERDRTGPGTYENKKRFQLRVAIIYYCIIRIST